MEATQKCSKSTINPRVEECEKWNWQGHWPGSGCRFISVPQSHHFRQKTAIKLFQQFPQLKDASDHVLRPLTPKPVNCPLRGFMGHKNPSKRHLYRSSSSYLWGHRNILHMLPVDGALAPLRPTRSCVFLTGEKRFHRYPDKAYSSTRSWRWQQTRSELWVMLGWLKPQPPPLDLPQTEFLVLQRWPIKSVLQLRLWVGDWFPSTQVPAPRFVAGSQRGKDEVAEAAHQQEERSAPRWRGYYRWHSARRVVSIIYQTPPAQISAW